MAEKSNVPTIATGSVGIVALTMLLALGGSQSSPPSSGNDTTKRGVVAARDQFREQSGKNALDLLRAFYGFSSPKVLLNEIGRVEKIQETIAGNNPKQIQREGPPKEELLTEPEINRVITEFKLHDSRVVIATVPDPIDNHVSFKFDETVEALQNAAGDAGWSLDRFSFNWPNRETTDKSSARDGGESDRYRTEPSVILFRSADFDSKQVLLMFLVGETPTAGVNRIALRSALLQASQYLATPKTAIIGPNYSGAFASLRDELMNKPPGLIIDVITGSATSTELRKSFAQSFDSGRHPGEVNFHSTVWSDAVVWDLVSYFLDHSGIPNEKVALLVESDSAYGDSISKYETGEKQKSGVRILRFPMHISLLRSKYQIDQRFRASTPGRSDPAEPSAIEISSEEPDNPQDLPPAYTPMATDNLAELAIKNIVSATASRGIQAVGLYATDSRDKLFLARVVRSVNPDAVLFTSESDLLYAHPDFSTDLYGSLVFSTFPLAPQTQIWGDTKTPIRQFTSQSANGIYTALFAALKPGTGLTNKDDYVLETEDTSNTPLTYPQDSLSPFGKPAEGPLLWVSALGRDKAWPIAAFVYFRGIRTVPALEDHPKFEAPRSFELLFILGSIGCWVVYSMYTFEFRKGMWLGMLKGLENKAPKPRRRFNVSKKKGAVTRSHITLLIALFFALLLALYCVVSVITILPSYKYQSPLAAWAPLLAAITSIILTHGFLDVVIRTRTGNEQNWKAQLAVWLLSIFLIVLMIFFLLPYLFGTDTLVARILLYDRSIQLGSGVSPLAPLAFLSLGMCTWTVCALKRLELLQYWEHVNPFPATAKGKISLLSSFREFREIILNSLKIMPKPGRVIAAVIFSSIILLGLFGHFGLSVLDRVWMVWSARISLTIMVGMIVLTVVQFLILWFQLRRLLRALSAYPLRDAFKRIPHTQAHGLGTFMTCAPPTLVELGESLERLKTASTNSKGIEAEFELFEYLKKKAESGKTPIEDSFEREIHAAAGFNQITWAFSSDTQKALAAQARVFWEKLPDMWKIRSIDGTFRLPRFVDDHQKEIAATVRTIEEFVAIQVVTFLSYVFLHLRILLTSMIVGVVCIMLAIGSYPFRPLNLMMNTAWFAVMCVAMGIIATLGQMRRNEILVAISQDGDGNTNWERGFLGQMILFGGVPLLTFLAAKFPVLGNVLFSWLGPALHTFHIG